MALEHRRFDVHEGRINVDWHYLTAEGERRHQFHSERLYTFTELSAMFSRAGLTVLRTWGGMDGREFDRQSPRMDVLAERT